jgi:hypothetical protein
MEDGWILSDPISCEHCVDKEFRDGEESVRPERDVANYLGPIGAE